MLTVFGLVLLTAATAAVAYAAFRSTEQEPSPDSSFCIAGPTDHTPRWPRRTLCQVPDFVPEEWS